MHCSYRRLATAIESLVLPSRNIFLAAPFMSIAKHSSKVTLPQHNTGFDTVLDYLAFKFPQIARSVWLQRMDAGNVHWPDSERITEQTAYKAQGLVHYYREVASEPKIPFKEQILYQDEHILVVHKPHFLTLMPGGVFVNECLQRRLQVSTGNDDLQGLHRLDRMTAGLVLFSCDVSTRAAYHALFSERKISKRYQAVAQVDASQNLVGQSWVVKNRLAKSKKPSFLMRVADGDANSHSNIRCIAQRQDKALFELEPVTGRTHQLRVHMQSLGMPLLNDNFYPVLQDKSADNFEQPLQLLAKSLAFVDPITGEERFFESPEELSLEGTI